MFENELNDLETCIFDLIIWYLKLTVVHGNNGLHVDDEKGDRPKPLAPKVE